MTERATVQAKATGGEVLPSDRSSRAAAPEKGFSLWQDAWRRLRRNKMAMGAMGLLGVLVVLSIAGPWFSPYDFDAIDLDYGAQGPSREHWMGTDISGRDLMTRILYGGRLS